MNASMDMAALRSAAQSICLEESANATDILQAAAQAINAQVSAEAQRQRENSHQKEDTPMAALQSAAEDVEAATPKRSREATRDSLKAAEAQLGQQDQAEGEQGFVAAAEEFRQIEAAVAELAEQSERPPSPIQVPPKEEPPKTFEVPETTEEPPTKDPSTKQRPRAPLPNFQYTQTQAPNRRQHRRPLERVSKPQKSRPSHIAQRVSQMSGTGISKSQKLMLEKSKRMGGRAKKELRISRDKLEDLAKPKVKHEGTLYKTVESERALHRAMKGKTKEERMRMSYGADTDMKNCKFKPKTKINPFGEVAGDFDDDGPKDKNAIIYKLEAYKRGIDKAREGQIGKNEYDIKLDKRQCPQCGAVQSYDEVIEKRKKCPNCGVTYRKKSVWNKVEKEFLERQYKSQEKVKHKVETLRQKEMKSMGKPDFKSSFGSKIATLTDEDFLVRVQDDLYRRELRKAQYEYEVDDAIPKGCTFEPKLSKDFRMPVSDASFTERMEVDIHRRQGGRELLSDAKSTNQRYSFRGSFDPIDISPEKILLRDSVSFDTIK